MKRILMSLLMVALLVTCFVSCSHKQTVNTEPTKGQTVATKGDTTENVNPSIERPQPSDEEMFQQKTLDELNKQGFLKRINFDFDKYDIREDMKPILESNANWLLKHPTVVVTIGGHCDEKGTEEYNMALGEKRALAAKNYLVSLGVSAAKLNTVSYGKTMPLVKGLDEESFFANRRAEFVIVKK